MTLLKHELRLIVRSRLSVAALVLLLILSALSVWSGLAEVQRQRDTIGRVITANEQDVARLAKPYEKGGDAGDAAYYTFYTTWDAPSTLAFAALGQRDVAPYVLRIRALGLEAQLYEGETFNPELALPGRFDFAFVLIYLAPLFVVALLHDLVSSERESGRLRLLSAMPGSTRRLWVRRTGLRFGLLFAGLALPFLVGAVLSGAGIVGIGAVAVIVAAYLAFWFAVALWVATRAWTSVANATGLMGAWVILTLVLPTLANVVIARAIPVPQGVDLMLAQRQNVHAAWERPRAETMTKFFKSEPEWKDTPPIKLPFEWKWYFAFHQVGDESVAPQARSYQAGLTARQDWTARLGWLLPGVGAQYALHRLAETDLKAQLAYQDRIRAFHARVRRFYYPYLFEVRPFGSRDFAKRPRFEKAG
ncbi:MAG: DUF3526 domain-containing protein [Sphingomonadales bacterium]